MSASSDTIVAKATANGRAGIGVLRISGALVREIADALLGAVPRPRRAVLRLFRDQHGHAIDQGIALFFPSPNSYTGEDVLELQGHGGPVVLETLAERIRELGARDAHAGEFSERAFLNDKMDLTQAEAVADLIDSASASAARAAMQSLRGAFSEAVADLQKDLIALRMHVEAAIDFPEEEIDFLSDAALLGRVDQVRERFDALAQRVEQGRRLTDGVSVVMIGAPNVGKSSLLNALLGEDAAIVTEIPGTTRDLVQADAHIAGVPLRLTDTAGLRETDDRVEQEGIRRSRRALADAEQVLVVVDASQPLGSQVDALTESLLPHQSVSVVCNKMDLVGASNDWPESVEVFGVSCSVFPVSALNGDGIPRLANSLADAVAGGDASEGQFTARQRHVTALTEARSHFDAGVSALEQTRAGELLAEELRLAQQSLESLTGRFTSDDLLGEIFSSFCIGK